MNIIKLKDIIKPNDSYFNKHLKGKYAYWVHMRYIVSFDHMKHEGYVACEEDINKLLKDKDGNLPKPYGAPYIDIYETDITPYIDIYETDKVNCVTLYRIQNNYTTDCNITLDELKKFRTWLATQLLKFDQNNLGEQMYSMYSEETTHVLSYYANGMYNDIVKYLSIFGAPEASANITNVGCGCNSNTSLSSFNKSYNSIVKYNMTLSKCGCTGGANLSPLYNSSLSNCNALEVYRKNIYDSMIKIFSEIGFWTQFPKEFILEFKKYIDNILDSNLKLTKSSYVSDFVDCGCDTTDNQTDMQAVLKRLSESLQHIADENISGKKNYITDAFNNWSVYLYELMEW